MAKTTLTLPTTERVIQTARAPVPLTARHHAIHATALELSYDHTPPAPRRWQLTAHIDRRDLLTLFREGISPIEPPQILTLDPFKPIRLVMTPDPPLAAALDGIEDERPVIDPKTGQIHPHLKPTLLDLTRHHFTEATTA